MAELYVPRDNYVIKAGENFEIPAIVQGAQKPNEKQLIWEEEHGCVNRNGRFTAPKEENDHVYKVVVRRVEDPDDMVEITITAKGTEPDVPLHNITDENDYRGLWDTFRFNIAMVRQNPIGFLASHFVRPTITLIITLSVLYFGGSGKLGMVISIILGLFIGWKVSKRSLMLGLLAIIGLPTFSYFFPGIVVGTLTFGAWGAYIFGGISYLVEVLSKDKEGKPITNTFPAVPIIFFVLMMLLNFLGIFSSSIPDKTPSLDTPDSIYLGDEDIGQEEIDLEEKESEGFFTRLAKKPWRAVQNSINNLVGVFDWLACVFLLTAYVALTEIADRYNKERKETVKVGDAKKEKKEKGKWWESAGKAAVVFEVFEVFRRLWGKIFKR